MDEDESIDSLTSDDSEESNIYNSNLGKAELPRGSVKLIKN